jgi:hypothetical protein
MLVHCLAALLCCCVGDDGSRDPVSALVARICEHASFGHAAAAARCTSRVMVAMSS